MAQRLIKAWLTPPALLHDFLYSCWPDDVRSAAHAALPAASQDRRFVWSPTDTLIDIKVRCRLRRPSQSVAQSDPICAASSICASRSSHIGGPRAGDMCGGSAGSGWIGTALPSGSSPGAPKPVMAAVASRLPVVALFWPCWKVRPCWRLRFWNRAQRRRRAAQAAKIASNKLPRPKGRGIRRFASQLTSFAVPEERRKRRGIYPPCFKHQRLSLTRPKYTL